MQVFKFFIHYESTNPYVFLILIYYLCGKYPNQYYSQLPCYYSQNTCPGGGRLIGVGCTSSAQCVPYYNGVSTCVNGCCCTVPNVTITTPIPSGSGFCYNGQTSNIRCSAVGQCPASQTCMNGLCCNTTGNEYLYACGGLGALGSCSSNSGTCSPSGSTCTPSNYCCECPVGRSSGLCNAV
uniref:CC domain-containing protein n=1 Tax=Acrobeloides nanus TaxID=290746 RepID=A0A914CV22_9BILA